MIKKTVILLVLYFFCSFTLLVCGEKNILPNLTNSQEPDPFFGPLEPEPLEKNTRSWSLLKKKVRSQSRAAKKFAGSSALLFVLSSLLKKFLEVSKLPHKNYLILAHLIFLLQYWFNQSNPTRNKNNRSIFILKFRSFFALQGKKKYRLSTLVSRLFNNLDATDPTKNWAI